MGRNNQDYGLSDAPYSHDLPSSHPPIKIYTRFSPILYAYIFIAIIVVKFICCW